MLEIGLNSLYIWATFVKKQEDKNFKNLPFLVTLGMSNYKSKRQFMQTITVKRALWALDGMIMAKSR